MKRIFSNTNTGPVLPRIVRGWPAKREYATPVSEAPNRDSMALCRHRGEGGSEGVREGGRGRRSHPEEDREGETEGEKREVKKRRPTDQDTESFD